MKKIIFSLIIALALAFVLPVTVKAAEEETDIKCMCNNGEECQHGLPTRTFKSFDEWEEYYLSHQRIGIFWDSYLYKSYAYRYNANGKVIWRPGYFYPFEDIETWKYWLDTCFEKQRTGVYKYEWPYGQPRK